MKNDYIEVNKVDTKTSFRPTLTRPPANNFFLIWTNEKKN